MGVIALVTNDITNGQIGNEGRGIVDICDLPGSVDDTPSIAKAIDGDMQRCAQSAT
jgi:hypothetical protein